MLTVIVILCLLLCKCLQFKSEVINGIISCEVVNSCGNTDLSDTSEQLSVLYHNFCSPFPVDYILCNVFIVSEVSM
jgi:hypothetical protein